mmetsp:Transcript_4010/g.25216  ORF Transcript_4010/g.25216 Transcript_4010/m.25216 type:complete len:250 (-) Transcript_4010:411-1160(-)
MRSTEKPGEHHQQSHPRDTQGGGAGNHTRIHRRSENAAQVPDQLPFAGCHPRRKAAVPCGNATRAWEDSNCAQRWWCLGCVPSGGRPCSLAEGFASADHGRQQRWGPHLCHCGHKDRYRVGGDIQLRGLDANGADLLQAQRNHQPFEADDQDRNTARSQLFSRATAEHTGRLHLPGSIRSLRSHSEHQRQPDIHQGALSCAQLSDRPSCADLECSGGFIGIPRTLPFHGSIGKGDRWPIRGVHTRGRTW